MEAVNGIVLSIVNFVLYSFWFALLVFVIFMLYMTFVTVKANELKQKTEKKRLEYKKYYKSLMYSIPLLACIMVSVLYEII